MRTADLFPGWEALPQLLVGEIGVVIARMLRENRLNEFPKDVIGRFYDHRAVAFLETRKEYIKMGQYRWRSLCNQGFVPPFRYDPV